MAEPESRDSAVRVPGPDAQERRLERDRALDLALRRSVAAVGIVAEVGAVAEHSDTGTAHRAAAYPAGFVAWSGHPAWY